MQAIEQSCDVFFYELGLKVGIDKIAVMMKKLGLGQQIISQEVAKNSLAMLRGVVTEGTASLADVNGYFVAGKTGTADKPSAQGGYDKEKNITSFASIFPRFHTGPAFISFKIRRASEQYPPQERAQSVIPAKRENDSGLSNSSSSIRFVI